MNNNWRTMSIGEAIDKMTILQVKCLKLTDTKREMAKKQYKMMIEGYWSYFYDIPDSEIQKKILDLSDRLLQNNLSQWDTENAVFEATNAEDGIKAAKLSRKYNMIRAEIKRDIDKLFGEVFLEEKDYSEMKELK